MAGFFHFVPCEKAGLVEGKRVRLEVLREYGLGDVLADCERAPDDLVIVEAPQGPGGLRGVTLYPKNPAAPSPLSWGYAPAAQTWRDVSGGRWLGWETDNPPTPEDLERKRVFRDYKFNDDAGRKWSVPCARSPRGHSGLPVEYGFAPDGSLTRHVAAEFEDLWTLSGEVLDAATGREDRDEAWAVRAALTCLQTNYRIGPAEVSALRELGRAVLTNQSIWGVLYSLIDQDLEQEGAEALLKKTTTETATTTTNEGNGRPPRPSSNASSGRGDASPDTDRAAEASPSPPCSTA